jgi:hypothetical protein
MASTARPCGTRCFCGLECARDTAQRLCISGLLSALSGCSRCDRLDTFSARSLYPTTARREKPNWRSRPEPTRGVHLEARDGGVAQLVRAAES